jgi:hypothetical protein
MSDPEKLELRNVKAFGPQCQVYALRGGAVDIPIFRWHSRQFADTLWPRTMSFKPGAGNVAEQIHWGVKELDRLTLLEFQCEKKIPWKYLSNSASIQVKETKPVSLLDEHGR